MLYRSLLLLALSQSMQIEYSYSYIQYINFLLSKNLRTIILARLSHPINPLPPFWTILHVSFKPKIYLYLHFFKGIYLYSIFNTRSSFFYSILPGLIPSIPITLPANFFTPLLSVLNLQLRHFYL